MTIAFWSWKAKSRMPVKVSDQNHQSAVATKKNYYRQREREKKKKKLTWLQHQELLGQEYHNLLIPSLIYDWKRKQLVIAKNFIFSVHARKMK